MRYTHYRKRIKTGDLVLTSRDDEHTKKTLTETGCRWSGVAVAVWGADAGFDPDRLYAWSVSGYSFMSEYIIGAEVAIRHLDCTRTETMRHLCSFRACWPGRHTPQALYEAWGLLPELPATDVVFWAGPVKLLTGATLSPLYKVGG